MVQEKVPFVNTSKEAVLLTQLILTNPVSNSAAC